MNSRGRAERSVAECAWSPPSFVARTVLNAEGDAGRPEDGPRTGGR